MEKKHGEVVLGENRNTKRKETCSFCPILFQGVRKETCSFCPILFQGVDPRGSKWFVDNVGNLKVGPGRGKWG